MDFYDAMKKGTSEEDLVKAFNEALNAAKKKLEDERRTKEEQEKEKAKKIIDNRRALAANALTSYLEVLCPETKITKEDIEKTLRDSESLFDSMSGFLTQFISTAKDGKAKTNVHFKKVLNKDDDDTVLDKFFDQLSWMF